MDSTTMDRATLYEMFTKLCSESRNFKQYFNVNDCVEGIIFKVILPINDIFSDFLVADQMLKSDYKNKTINKLASIFVYFFIANPGFMILLFNLGVFTDRLCKSRCQGLCLTIIIYITYMTMEAALPFYGNPTAIFCVALLVSSCFLLVGFLDVIFHGPCMKKVSNLLTNYEGRYESAPQFFIQILILLAGPEFYVTTAIDIYSMCTSLLVLSKDLAENILSNCPKSPLSKMSISAKMSAMKKIIPVIILTTIFRLGTIALATLYLFVFDHNWLLVPLQCIIILPPAITLLYLKYFSSLAHQLSVIDCFVGIMGEMSAFSIWGKLRHNESRWIQLGFQVYFGILNSGYCIWTVFNPPKVNADLYAIIFFCCGWTAFPLYLTQVFYLDQDTCDDDDGKEMWTLEENITMSMRSYLDLNLIQAIGRGLGSHKI